MDDRRGSAWFGLPAMIGLFAFVAFAKAGGFIVAIVATVILLLIIGAVLTTARKRPRP
jgi:VIT1/CCC1 family predicted Fe2+/Mn2+ transporter